MGTGFLFALRTPSIISRSSMGYKDEASRLALLEDAIASSLSLNEIRERVKALKPPTEPPPFASRIETISKLVKKHQVWDDPKKRKKLETLLAKIEG